MTDPHPLREALTPTPPAAHVPSGQSGTSAAWVKVRAMMARGGLMWDQLNPWWSPDTNSDVDPLADPETRQSLRHFVAWLWRFALEQESSLADQRGMVSREEHEQALAAAVRDGYVFGAGDAAGGPGMASTPATEPPLLCPTCGYDGRQANVYRSGVLWTTCRDPWHHDAAAHQEPTPATEPPTSVTYYVIPDLADDPVYKRLFPNRKVTDDG